MTNTNPNAVNIPTLRRLLEQVKDEDTREILRGLLAEAESGKPDRFSWIAVGVLSLPLLIGLGWFIWKFFTWIANYFAV